MAKTPPELQEALRRFEQDVQDLAAAARAAVLDVIGPCFEQIFPIQKLVSVVYSTTEKRMKDNICVLVIYRDHVNLMFPRGVDLNDPNGLLEGSGSIASHSHGCCYATTRGYGLTQRREIGWVDFEHGVG